MPYVPGPYDSAHYYLQWGGKLPGNEQWSCGMRLRATVGAANDAEAGLMLPFLAGHVESFHTRPASLIYPNAKLSFVKLNAIGTDGHYISAGTREQAFADISGGSVGVVHPNQVALVASLETGFSRGPAHRGRFYIPMPTSVVESSGLISVVDATNVAGSVKDLIDAINVSATNAEVAVFSRKLGTPGNRRVTGVKVGLVMDTQRRRRRSLIENYQVGV